MTTAVGYIRVSTAGQERSGLSLEAQRAALRSSAAQRGWTLHLLEDTCSGKVPLGDRLRGRSALQLLAERQCEAMIVAKVDRLGRNVHDASGIIRLACDQGWTLVLLDVGLDTSTPMGKAMAHMAMTFAELEHERISERQRDAWSSRRQRLAEQGRTTSEVTPAITARVLRERQAGASYPVIASALNSEGVPTPRGKRWHASSVRNVELRGRGA